MHKAIIAILLISSIYAQQRCHQAQEYHPSITTKTCDESGCQSKENKIVIDGNWRWTHHFNDYKNCYTGNAWDPNYCPDVDTCTQECGIDGITQEQDMGTYGMSVSGDELSLKLVTKQQYGTNVGLRTYLMMNDYAYEHFQLRGKEFSFDVDVSGLPCGLNGALYFVEMDQDGGKSKYPTNQCGAEYGTGYCDAQCPHDLKWINGEANMLDWDPSSAASGTGHYGTCCAEMDIWEANSQATQITPHACSVEGQYRCEGTECGDNASGDRYKGVCDKDGCDFNPSRMGQEQFFGKGSGFTVDTSKKMQVVTQFIEGTPGELTEIKRFYVQDGNVISNPDTKVSGLDKYNSVTQEHCDAQKELFGETNSFKAKGGMENMGKALARGMVLVMSLWDDHDAQMLWLDGKTYPKGGSGPGVHRGPCADTTGVPDDVEREHPDATVKFSNIKFGTINSTFTPPGPGPTPGGECTDKSSGYYCTSSGSTTFYQCPSGKSYDCVPPGTHCVQTGSASVECLNSSYEKFLDV